MAAKYDHQAIEKKWQQRWLKEKVFVVDNAIDPTPASGHPSPQLKGGGRTYILDMFPYPSADGLHVGHPEGYTASDIVTRYQRMKGVSVLHPMGWDAFGLPAENYAIKKGVHPRAVTEQNVQNFKRQIQSIGFSYDWNREVNTTDPAYYKWTQWIFLQLFKQGLAYEKEAPIWWCPKDKTGLANEEVVDGKCDRCGTAVERKMLKQWMLKITAYAERLLNGLVDLDWPEGIKTLQRNWIGKSEGALITFSLRGITGQADDKHSVQVFTTRPDTIFGATFLVISPELAQSWLNIGWKASAKVKKYITQSLSKTEIDRQDTKKAKTGVDSGIKAVNPASKEEIPVWVADYVLGGYGTGAIMAVPAHDERDWEFAVKNKLPIRQVVAPMYENTTDLIPRPELPTVKRPVVYVMVKHPKKNEYLGLKWKTLPWQSFPMGGVEDGEDVIEAARREVLEETGYKNLKFIRHIDWQVHTLFFAPHKKENRYGIATAVMFQLENEERDTIKTEEAEQHTAVWVPTKKVRDFITHGNAKALWDHAQQPQAYIGEGIAIHSGDIDGLKSDAARTKITAWLERQAYGQAKVQYKLRDWVFSRQRYWGEPIPLVHCATCGVVPVPEDQLPVLLPDVKKYEPTGTGESPLAAITDWVNTTCPKCGGAAKRETNTMPQWAGSCWYYLRFCDPQNDKEFASAEALKTWLPVNLYVGGAEHAVLHLLYSRFWHMVLHDIGAIPKENSEGQSLAEPFQKLKNQGLILGPDGEKMSKSRGNVINPDEIIAKFGADTLRMYEMFMGPFEDAKPWDTNGMIGVRRFLERVWSSANKVDRDQSGRSSFSHKYVARITAGIEQFQFNTCVSDLMKWSNDWKSAATISLGDFEVFLKLLSPFAPHIAEELWSTLDHEKALATEPWPTYDETLLKEDTASIVIQVNGKLRGMISLPTGSNETVVRAAAEVDQNVKKFLTGEPKKVIFVPDKLINFVI